MPGRGLEPLRISPPDPKSGASANFATLAEIPATVLAQILAQSPVLQPHCRRLSRTRQTYTPAVGASDFKTAVRWNKDNRNLMRFTPGGPYPVPTRLRER